MNRRFLIASLPFSALLLMGSSGCTTSDIDDILGILGTSKGSTVIDDAAGALGVDVKSKDEKGVLGTEETLDPLKQAGKLEEEADAALSGTPPDYKTAKEKLDEAIKLRPDDWGLRNRQVVLAAERGEQAESLNSLWKQGSDICEGKAYASEAAKERCKKALMQDRERELEASVARQKSGGSVSCQTYAVLASTYLKQADYYKALAATDKANERSHWDKEDYYADKASQLHQLRSTGNCVGGTAAPPS